MELGLCVGFYGMSGEQEGKGAGPTNQDPTVMLCRYIIWSYLGEGWIERPPITKLNAILCTDITRP